MAEGIDPQQWRNSDEQASTDDQPTQVADAQNETAYTQAEQVEPVEQSNQTEQSQQDAQSGQYVQSDQTSYAQSTNDAEQTTVVPTPVVEQTAVTQPISTASSVAQPTYTPAPEYGAYSTTTSQTPVAEAQSAQAQSDTQAQAAAQAQPTTQAQTPEYGAYGSYGAQSQFGQQYTQQYQTQYQDPAQQTSAQQTSTQQSPYMYGAPANDQSAYNQQNMPFANDPQSNDPHGANGANGADNENSAGSHRKSNTMMVAITTGVISVVASTALCLGLGMAAINNGWVSTPASSSSMSSISSNTGGTGSAKAVSGQAPDWQSVAKSVSSSVVAIQTEVEVNGQSGVAKGSGAIISKDGYIVTNNHVINGAKQIQVTLSTGSVYEAEVVGTDVTTDLAVIKLKNGPTDLTPVTFADSDKLAVGENIMAIGNPLGYENTATTGIVSALNRPVTVMDEENNQIVTNAVQIDAAINPGNSGGPTFNAAGQVIGINSSIATSSSGSASSSSEAGSIGIGFAIPSNLVQRVANEIMKNGKVQHVALGVTVTTDSVEVDGATRTGAKITNSNGSTGVVSGSPADKAGLKVGDVIIGYNGKAVNSVSSLLGFVRATAMNEEVTLTIVRDGKSMDVKATLDKAESAVNGSNRTESSNGSSSDGNSNNGNSQNNGNSNNQNGNGNSDSNGNSFDPFNFGW